MLKIISGLILTFSLQAGAMSLHPCTPTVEAMPTRISCKQGNIYYSIIIKTLMSRNLEMCQGENFVEYQTAYVKKSSQSGKTLGQVTILNGDFKYKLGMGGEAWFKSKNPKLNLNNCASPQHGGFSIGN